MAQLVAPQRLCPQLISSSAWGAILRPLFLGGFPHFRHTHCFHGSLHLTPVSLTPSCPCFSIFTVTYLMFPRRTLGRGTLRTRSFFSSVGPRGHPKDAEGCQGVVTLHSACSHTPQSLPSHTTLLPYAVWRRHLGSENDEPKICVFIKAHKHHLTGLYGQKRNLQWASGGGL